MWTDAHTAWLQEHPWLATAWVVALAIHLLALVEAWSRHGQCCLSPVAALRHLRDRLNVVFDVLAAWVARYLNVWRVWELLRSLVSRVWKRLLDHVGPVVRLYCQSLRDVLVVIFDVTMSWTRFFWALAHQRLGGKCLVSWVIGLMSWYGHRHREHVWSLLDGRVTGMVTFLALAVFFTSWAYYLLLLAMEEDERRRQEEADAVSPEVGRNRPPKVVS